MVDQPQQPNPAPASPAPTSPTPLQQWELRRRRPKSSKPPDRRQIEYLNIATAGSEPDRIVNSTLYRWLKRSAFVCIPLALLWLVWAGYKWGNYGCYTCYKNQPVATAPEPVKTETNSEIKQFLKEIGEKITNSNPATATASATSAAESAAKADTPLKVAVTVPGIDRLASAVEKMSEQPVTDPTAGMTPKERCDYEIIRLRRARCSQ